MFSIMITDHVGLAFLVGFHRLISQFRIGCCFEFTNDLLNILAFYGVKFLLRQLAQVFS